MGCWVGGHETRGKVGDTQTELRESQINEKNTIVAYFVE